MGETHREMENVAEARHFFQEALNLFRKIGTQHLVAQVELNLKHLSS